LPNFATSKGSLLSNKVYYNSGVKSQADAKNKLEKSGFNCVDVPCPLKNSADNQLIVDCLRDVNNNSSLKTVILVSGDGDFVDLILTLKKLGIKVIVLAQQGNVKQKLKEVADEFYFIDKLPELVKNETQHLPTLDKCKLTFTEACKYLIEALKTALNQGKHTKYPIIDKLMRELCPNYQGVSSICKPDGKKFAKFSQFVKAVVKVSEGKIKVEKDELILIG